MMTVERKTVIKRAINKYYSPHGAIISNNTSNIVRKGNIIRIPPEIFAFMYTLNKSI